MIRAIFFLFCFLLFGASFAQPSLPNLVQDPSFETLRNPKKMMLRLRPSKALRYWRELALGDIGYIHPEVRYFKPEQNPIGKQKPRTGNGFVWLKTGGLNTGGDENYGDVRCFYIQTKLKKTLKKDYKYRVEFYVSLAESSQLAIDQLGAYLSPKPLKSFKKAGSRMYHKSMSSTGAYLDFVGKYAQIMHKNGIIEDTQKWVKVSGEFVAQGGEQFLTLGNFTGAAKSAYKIVRQGSLFPESFYFIEDVGVFELGANTPSK